ncbi:MAG: iron chelate uptake ABC transporter family permease subunit [Gammaproteobacteria bacterium]|nr:metal ABC transporter permease [Pseudomonadales bacterium]MCP5347785.1 metal ABC transporter permease [Pseudomonadales bacterium]
MADFILYALVAGLSLAIVAGPLGSFVVWRRMSYFGDTLAHSALLGISLGLLLDLNLQLSIICICVLTGILLMSMNHQLTVATDTLLGILAHSALAIGVVLLALTGSTQVSLEAYLFGELLTISTPDLALIVTVSTIVFVILLSFWNKFLSFTVHEELASIEGVKVEKLRYLLVILMAVTTAAALKIVGVLLITSLLIIPPAAARQLARSPEQMAIMAGLIGSVSVLGGLTAAFLANTPVGPSIVVTAALIFLVLYLLPIPAKKHT